MSQHQTTVVGGDWELEVTSGNVETGMYVDSSGLSRYGESLGVVDDIHKYVEIAVHENSKVIGVGIFDLSLDGGTEANFNNFVALISNYERNDFNFDGEYSWGERLSASILPKNLSNSKFTYIAYKQLAIELSDTQFDQKANQKFVSIATDLTEWGFSEAYGIEKSFLLTLANQVKGPIIGSIVENAVDGFIPQFFLKKGIEYLLDELIGSFTPDKTDESYDIRYIENANGSYSDDHDYLYEGSSSSDSINISTGSGRDILIGGSGNDTIDAGGGNDTIYSGRGDIIDAGSGNDTITIENVKNGYLNIDGGTGFDTVDVDFSLYHLGSVIAPIEWRRDINDSSDPRLGWNASFNDIYVALADGIEKLNLHNYGGDVNISNVEQCSLSGTFVGIYYCILVATDMRVEMVQILFMRTGQQPQNQLFGTMTRPRRSLCREQNCQGWSVC